MLEPPPRIFADGGAGLKGRWGGCRSGDVKRRAAESLVFRAGRARWLGAGSWITAWLLGVCSAGASPDVVHGSPADQFRDEVWPKVGARSCLECHRAGGEAEDSDFVLLDPSRERTRGTGEWLQHNRAAFARMAARHKDGESRLLLKATGQLGHEGEVVLEPGSTGHQILAAFVARAAAIEDTAMDSTADEDFFTGITLLDDRRLLRRVTLSLAARLPSADELAAVTDAGPEALGPILDRLLEEEAFYERLAEAFNDLFLVRGYVDGAESALSYEHFSETRHWTQKYDLSHIEDERERTQAGYKLANDYREALLREPLELIKHIVRENRPFTEIVTADYKMVSPFTARGYGMFEELKERFTHPDDPFEYIPVKLASLKNRTGQNHQESATGYYPHAGMAGEFQYLRRYPTTETNRNRLRARMYYQHFLGVEVLELAARTSDAAAVTAKYEIPTMQAADCVICHKTLDPLAGVFQDYYSFEGVFGPRKEGWFEDMFSAGFEGEALPAEERWRALQWLGERTAADPRFAATMVDHVYYVLTGRRVLLPPTAIEDPMFGAKHRAYQAQRDEVDRIAAGFVASGFNLKTAFKEWIASRFYRADGIQAITDDPQRLVELADVGVVRMLGPEQIERKVAAIFGKAWGRLDEPEYNLLYGGIDSDEVTERATDPSGAMGAIHRTLANDLACRNVAADFAKPAGERRFFPDIEPDVVPDGSEVAERRIRSTIMHLHEFISGRTDASGSPEVEMTYQLFAGIVEEAGSRGDIEPRESYFCRAEGEDRPLDPHYTLRAWRAVLTYLLRQREFIYE